MSRRCAKAAAGMCPWLATPHAIATMTPAAIDPKTWVSTKPSRTVVGAMPMTNEESAMPRRGVPITERKALACARLWESSASTCGDEASTFFRASGANVPTASMAPWSRKDRGTGIADTPRLSAAAAAIPKPHASVRCMRLSPKKTAAQFAQRAARGRPAKNEHVRPSALTTGEETSAPNATRAM